jgi:hypothetical protein
MGTSERVTVRFRRHVPDRSTLVRAALVLCLLNVVLVSTLGVTGVLRTAERGDVTTIRSTTLEDGRVTLPEDSRPYVHETPTDARFYYNIVIHYLTFGELYPGNGKDPYVALGYKYAPPVTLVYAALFPLGYLWFKVGLLLLSVGAVVAGTYLFLRAETDHRDLRVDSRSLAVVSVAAIGFQPMVANFKVAQSTPLVYLGIAVGWYAARKGRFPSAGAGIAAATLVKPYFAAPLAALVGPGHRRTVGWFLLAYTLAMLLSVAVVGLDTVIAYYQILLRFVLAEGGSQSFDTAGAWTATQFRPFFALGPLKTPVQLVTALPAVYLSIRAALGRDEPPAATLGVTLAGLMLALDTTTAIDMGIMLAGLVVLGVWAYDTADQTTFALLFGAFFGMEVHAYTLEALLGWGNQNVSLIAANEELILTLVPVLQPGTYGVALVFVVAGLLRRSRRETRE